MILDKIKREYTEGKRQFYLTEYEFNSLPWVVGNMKYATFYKKAQISLACPCKEGKEHNCKEYKDAKFWDK